MLDEARKKLFSSLTIKNKKEKEKKEEGREIGIKRERERGVKTFDPTSEFVGKVLKTWRDMWDGWKNLSNRDRNRRIWNSPPPLLLRGSPPPHDSNPGKSAFFRVLWEREREKLNEGEFTSFNPPPLAPDSFVQKHSGGEKEAFALIDCTELFELVIFSPLFPLNGNRLRESLARSEEKKKRGARLGDRLIPEILGWSGYQEKWNEGE